MFTTFDAVSLIGYENVTVGLDVYVNRTSGETSDRLRIWVSDGAGAELNIIDTLGLDIDSLDLENKFTRFDLNLAGFSMNPILNFGLDSNSSREWVVFDNIQFTGDLTPIPLPAAAWLFLSGLVGLVSLSSRKSAKNSA